MQKAQNRKSQTNSKFETLELSFRISDFEFVSSFELRISFTSHFLRLASHDHRHYLATIREAFH